MAMEAILDLSQPIDVPLFESVVQQAMMTGASQAREVLERFLQLPDAFRKVDRLLDTSADPMTHHFALQVLEKAVLTQWNKLTAEDQLAIRHFIGWFLMQQCGDVHQMRANHGVVNKAIATFIAIAKREWPYRWPEFVQEIVAGADTSGQAVAEVALKLLGELADEIWVFGESTMTKRWIDRKKVALRHDFDAIWDLCGRKLVEEDPVVRRKALACVEKYVPIVEPERVVDEGFLNGVCSFLDSPETSCAALRVLIEVAAVTPPPGSNQLVEQLFLNVMERVANWLPPRDDPSQGFAEQIEKLYALGGPAEAEFVDALSLFLNKFLQKHMGALQLLSRDALVGTHDMLVGMLRVENKEIFKTCVDYVWWLGDFLKNPRHGMQGTAAQVHSLLEPQLSQFREALVLHMAKPEEVIIVETEDGEIEREHMADSETLSLYVTMREALIFLTHLDYRNMLNIIQRLMKGQVDGSEFSWGRINVLCWSFGAISGALTADVERNAFVQFLRDLLTMCEKTSGKENRAVIASGIMYVVGQYPRFLNNHPRFLRTVVAKNCDFMKEVVPGIKAMAVDTLLKVLRQCSAPLWDESSGVMGRELVGNIDFYASELDPAETTALFEAMGHLMAACPREQRNECMLRLLDTPNSIWQNLVQTVTEAGLQAILGADDLKQLIHALRCISRTGRSAGGSFIEEIQLIHWQLQQLYMAMSGEIAKAFSERGEAAKHLQQVRQMRRVQSEILRIIEAFIASAEDLDFVANQCVPPLFEVVLSDYAQSHPFAREPQVLNVVTAAFKTLKGHLSEGVSTILTNLFDSTVELITVDMESFPEHRVGLFSLIRAINSNCFEAFLDYVAASPAVIQGVLWATKHVEQNTSAAGLDALYDFLQRVALHEEAATWFLQEYAQSIATDILVAMLDTMHRPVFRRQVEVLQRLFMLAMNANADPSAPYSQAGIEAAMRVPLAERETLSEEQIHNALAALFANVHSLAHMYRVLSDLMVEVQVWNAEQENLDAKMAEREERENAVDGLARPSMGVRFSELNAELAED